jgi:signal transduction histidine kinase
VAETLAGADRVAAVVRDVRSFSQAAHGERERVDLNRLCEDALRVALPRGSKDLRVVRAYGEIPTVRCAPRELMQVFLNLFSNAAQAVGGAGTIRVATHADGEHVTVRVEDDGQGIAPDAIDRIFDPFFTTKPVGEGIGLGLSISRRIVLGHGGDLSVESGPGQGTCFRIRLPVSGEPPSGGEA